MIAKTDSLEPFRGLFSRLAYPPTFGLPNIRFEISSTSFFTKDRGLWGEDSSFFCVGRRRTCGEISVKGGIHQVSLAQEINVASFFTTKRREGNPD